jgi:hypothetical protein
MMSTAPASRDRVLCHQLAQKRDAVHPRHFHIQRDHVGDLVADARGGDVRVRGDAQHLDLRIRLQHGGQRVADRGGVIDDQNADFFAAQGHGFSFFERRCS